MLRAILAVFVGLAYAIMLTSLVQAFTFLVHPLKQIPSLADANALIRWIEAMPAEGYVLMLASHAVGSLAGGWAATRMSHRRITSALMIGLILMSAGLISVNFVPYPMWYALAVALICLPMAWAGSQIATLSPGQPAAEAPVAEEAAPTPG